MLKAKIMRTGPTGSISAGWSTTGTIARWHFFLKEGGHLRWPSGRDILGSVGRFPQKYGPLLLEKEEARRVYWLGGCGGKE